MNNDIEPEVTEIFCEKCQQDIPIEECVEVQAGLLTHESASGQLHSI